MKLRTKLVTKLALAAGAGALGAALVSATPAFASHDDSFHTLTTNGCGDVWFIDSGYYGPTNSMNDDFLHVGDNCSDGHGVQAYAWRNGKYLGSVYDAFGKTGQYVSWDPYQSSLGTNIKAGDSVGIKVCLVDGNNDTTPSKCGSKTVTSVDG